MTLDDLKNINLNEPATWPLTVKIVAVGIVCVAIVVGGFFFVIKGMLEEYEIAKQKTESLKETYLTKKALAINLPAYRQQMEEIEQTFGSLLRQLPNSTEVPDLLTDITQAGLGKGLEFVLFKPEKETPRDFYAELPISIEVRGSYHELAGFVSDVAALPRIVTFGNVTIAPAKTGGRLSMTAKARTYRYLDQSEIVKATAPKKGAAGKKK